MSQQTINIGGDKNDPNYRYKMHPLQTKIEGRGNGIKTVLVNISDVAKDLHTEPQYITRYFATEVGAVSQWDKKRNAGIVHGVHQSKDLQNILERFNNEFILCPKCKLPELQMKVDSDKGILWQRCLSCGWKGKNLSTHRVKTYIINNPPPSKKKSENDDAAKASGAPKTGKTKPKIMGTSSDMKDNETYVAPSEFREELGGDDDDIWSVDISDAAVNARKTKEMESLPKRPQGSDQTLDTINEEKQETTKNDDRDADTPSSNKQNDNPYQTSTKYIDEGPASVLRQYIANSNRSAIEILDEIKRIALARSLDGEKQMKVIFEGLCRLDDHEKFIDSLKKHARIISKFTKTPKDSQIFFSCLEEILARRNKNLLSKTYLILNALYDADIVTDEQILSWYYGPLENSIIEKDEVEEIRQIAKPFISWLEEDDDDDDDEDEDEAENEDEEDDENDNENENNNNTTTNNSNQ